MLPKGYYVIDEKKDMIVIGMDFSHFNEVCEKNIYWYGNKYIAGDLTYIPINYVGTFCSCREYHLVEGE